jgi:S-adenosylmethionine synthetase
LDAEKWLNSPEFKQRFPEAGEDVKVMGMRRDRDLHLTVAVAFVDRFVPDAGAYFRRKEEMTQSLAKHVLGKVRTVEGVSVQLNSLDDADRGEAGMYLTVLGTSAEGGDCGQVGRGNRVNGVIPLNRPIGTEAAAGKNPVSHVGKIYSLLTHRLAERLHQCVPGLAEVYVWLCSQIGQPIDAPVLTAVQVILQDNVGVWDVEPVVASVIEEDLNALPLFTQRLARGELPVW